VILAKWLENLSLIKISKSLKKNLKKIYPEFAAKFSAEIRWIHLVLIIVILARGPMVQKIKLNGCGFPNKAPLF
jgi:hypothetical protein